MPRRVAILRSDGKKQVLRRNILVFEAVRFLERALQHVVQRTSHVLLRKTVHSWQPANLALDFLGERFAADAQARDKRRHHAIGLRHQSRKQMHWLNLLVLVARGNFLRSLHSLLRFDGHFFKSQHNNLGSGSC